MTLLSLCKLWRPKLLLFIQIKFHFKNPFQETLQCWGPWHFLQHDMAKTCSIAGMMPEGEICFKSDILFQVKSQSFHWRSGESAENDRINPLWFLSSLKLKPSFLATFILIHQTAEKGFAMTMMGSESFDSLSPIVWSWCHPSSLINQNFTEFQSENSSWTIP